jgi:hypothetical protein
MSEDDTYTALRRIPFEELDVKFFELLKSNSPDWEAESEEMVKMFGWTKDDYYREFGRRAVEKSDG